MSALVKALPRLILVLGVALAWAAGIGLTAGNALSLSTAEQQIAENEELRTYKNVIDLYDEVIAAHPDDISWYERKADAYYALEEYRSYVSQCEKMISAFPDQPLGYQKLMAYYADEEDYQNVFGLYKRVPDNLKGEEGIVDRYAEYEYHYQYLAASRASTQPLSGGYGVIGDGLYGYMNAEGKTAIDCVFEEARPVLEDTIAVKRDGEWYIADLDGDRIHATRDEIEDLYSPSEGYALAKVNGRYGYFDDALANPQHFEYEDASVFYNGVAAVKQGGKWALVNASFDRITGFDFDDIVVDFAGVCSRGGFVFARRGGVYELLDLSGHRVGSESFDDARVFHGEWAAVERDGKWGFIDSSGSIVIECSYEGADSFANGIAPVEKGGLWGFIDTAGKMVVEPTFEGASYLSGNGVSAIDVGKSMRYIQFYKFSFEGE